MKDVQNRPLGIGSTPYDAACELAPDQSDEHVAWVAGLPAIPDSPDPPSIGNTKQYELNVIYDDRPEEQWLVEVIAGDNKWTASVIGRKKIG
jgi:hypothetical protein